MSKYKWQVDIVESERGWGQRVDEVKLFEDEQSAMDFVTDYNKHNNLPETPDWHMYATNPKKVKVK